MYLGNVVSEEKIIKNKLFNYSNNLCDIDRNIPTLIIGWEFTKKLFYDKKISILNSTIAILRENNSQNSGTKNESIEKRRASKIIALENQKNNYLMKNVVLKK